MYCGVFPKAKSMFHCPTSRPISRIAHDMSVKFHLSFRPTSPAQLLQSFFLGVGHSIYCLQPDACVCWQNGASGRTNISLALWLFPAPGIGLHNLYFGELVLRRHADNRHRCTHNILSSPRRARASPPPPSPGFLLPTLTIARTK